MMRRAAVIAIVGALFGACGGSSNSERKVLVDYSPDDVAVFVAKDFPAKVTVLPGQSIAFKQTWTGEPHTVTGGNEISGDLETGTHWFALFDGYTALLEHNEDLVNPEEPGDATFADFANALKAAKPAKDRGAVLDAWKTLRAEYPTLPDIDKPPATPFGEVNSLIDELSESAFDSLMFALGEDNTVNQNVAKPCYLRSGLPPEDTDEQCTAAQQRQPAFDGTHDFYNSGVIPYEGTRGNTFRMKIASNAKPGAYFFYCAVHGPDQRVEVDIAKPGTKVPSAQQVARAGRATAEKTVAPMLRTYREAVDKGSVNFHGDTIKGPFAGVPSDIYGSVNEFIPKTIQAKANAPITWKIMGEHTISFDVPSYLPILQFGEKIRLNPKVRDVAGGAPDVPDQEEDENEGGDPVKFDAGTYDGRGFWSSGVVSADPHLEYTLRISKPGTYPYACLIHPKMIGKVVVS